MATGFDLVAVRVEGESAVIVRVILRAQSRLSIAFAAGRKRCTVELTDGLPRRRSKRDVKAGGCRSARKRSHSRNTRTVPTPRTVTFLTHRLTISS